MNVLYDIVGECLLQHTGGEKFFDALDERIRDSDILMRAIMSKAIFNSEVPFDSIIVSGKFGVVFKDLCSRDYPTYEVVKVNGSLRGNGVLNLTDDNITSIRGKRFIFIDDSFYSGTTRNKIETGLQSHHASLEATYVIYDGSHVKDSTVHSLYRYYSD